MNSTDKGYNFTESIKFEDALLMNFSALGGNINAQDATRLREYRERWNFYKGFHWESIPETGKTEVTKNYCRAFVNKFIAFELGKGFSIRMKPEVENIVLPYLNEVWDTNNKLRFCQQLGQSKSVTGDGWVQVLFEPKYNEDGSPNKSFYDPYDEYEKGRIRVLAVPPNIVFPKFESGFDKDRLTEMVIMYPVRNSENQQVLYKQTWTRDKVVEEVGDSKKIYENKYKVIPFFHCKNLDTVGASFGTSDLEDIIPLNMELNLKCSDVSEIIEYHSAPITVIFGARAGQLDKGANKIWGGLPKESRVENLELQGDLGASREYIDNVKTSMHEIAGVPEGSLGKELAISNTSGVALQLMMMPLIERTRAKRANTSQCISEVNKFIIKIGLIEGLIEDASESKGSLDSWKKEDKYSKDLYYNEILFEETLPKDKLVELQALQLEMKMGIADRQEGMKRLGKEDIQQRLKEIDKDRTDYPEIYGIEIDKNTGEILTGRVDPNAMLPQQMSNGSNGMTKPANTPTVKKQDGKNTMNRGLNENKAGNQAEVNAGFQNSQKKKMKPNS